MEGNLSNDLVVAGMDYQPQAQIVGCVIQAMGWRELTRRGNSATFAQPARHSPTCGVPVVFTQRSRAFTMPQQ